MHATLASPAAKPSHKAAAPAPTGQLRTESEQTAAQAGMPLFMRGLQAKLAVGPQDDPLEREADQVAERVISAPRPAAGETLAHAPAGRVQRRCSQCAAPLDLDVAAGEARVQRKCATCSAGSAAPCTSCEEEDRLQRKGDAGAQQPTGAQQVDGARAERVHALRGEGRELPDSVRRDFEPRFGYDFSAVRVHTGSAASRSAQELGAQAYTLGQHIVFGGDRFAPDSLAGRRLLAHELTHTIQQTGGRPLAPAARESGTAAASQPNTISRSPDPRVQRSLLSELGLDDVCISDVCVQDVAEGIGELGIGGVTIGDFTSIPEDLAVDAIHATGVDLSFVGDVAHPVADLATAALDAAGIRLSIDGTNLTATLADIELGSIEVPVELPSFGGPIPLFALPLPPGIIAYVGVRFALEPTLILKLGPLALRQIRISADMFRFTAGGGAVLDIAGSIVGVAVGRGALEGGIVVPELGAMISLEGGLRYTATGVAQARLMERLSFALDGPDIVGSLLQGDLTPDILDFESLTSLSTALGLNVWLNAYAAARLNDKILCEYIWPGAVWRAGREWTVGLPVTASLGTGGFELAPSKTTASYRDVPFEEIGPKLGEEPPLGLNCLGFKDLLGEYDYEEPTEGIRICSRPLDFPIWTGLPAARHAYAHDAVTGANYAIREPLVWGNGVTTSCSPKTSASGAPDDVGTSRCKPCAPKPGTPESEPERVKEVSRCLQRAYNAYPGPNLYRNGPDRDAGGAWGPNSNSFGAAMASCCHEFDVTGLGILPGWNHGPATACPPQALGDVLEWIIGQPTPEMRVFELCRLSADQRSALLADQNQLTELEKAVGPALWPTATRILHGSASVEVPSLSAAGAYQVDQYIHFRVPDRAGLHARVDALYIVVNELQQRNVINPQLASWSYAAQTGTGEGLTSWTWQIDPDGTRRASGPAVVQIYDLAFADVPWLFSTVMHEWMHVLQAGAGKPPSDFGPDDALTNEAQELLEVEAYLYEIEHAVGSGVAANAAQLTELGERLTDHFEGISRSDKIAYGVRYRSAMRRVRLAQAGVPPMSIEEARRIVQTTSARIERALARRPGHEREVDAEIEELRRQRDAALIEVALVDNPSVQVVRPGATGDYRVQTVDADGRVRYVHGGILVAWQLGGVPASAFGLNRQLGSDPGLLGEPGAIAGTAAQGRVHPYPPDVDFDEHLDIRARSAWDAGKVVTNAIIGFVTRNEASRNVEFLNLAVFAQKGRGGTWFSRQQVLRAAGGDTTAFGRIAGAISRLGGGNLNTYWRGWVQNDPGRPGRFIDITKVMTIHAENPRTGEIYIDSLRFPDINLAFLDEPAEIPRGSVGTFGWEMCCQAVRRWRDGDHLKAAKRAYNYFTVVGDLASMARLEPLFRTPQARASMSVVTLEAIYSSLVTGRRAVATRILTAADARAQLLTSAAEIELLPDARTLAVSAPPRQSPAELARLVREIAPQLRDSPSGVLTQDGALARDLRDAIKEIKLHINLPLDAPAVSSPGVSTEGIVTAIVGRLDREVCPATACTR